MHCLIGTPLTILERGVLLRSQSEAVVTYRLTLRHVSMAGDRGQSRRKYGGWHARL